MHLISERLINVRPGSDVFDASTMTDLFSNQTLENKRCHAGQWVIRNYKLCTHTVVSSAQRGSLFSHFSGIRRTANMYVTVTISGAR